MKSIINNKIIPLEVQGLRFIATSTKANEILLSSSIEKIEITNGISFSFVSPITSTGEVTIKLLGKDYKLKKDNSIPLKENDLKSKFPYSVILSNEEFLIIGSPVQNDDVATGKVVDEKIKKISSDMENKIKKSTDDTLLKVNQKISVETFNKTINETTAKISTNSKKIDTEVVELKKISEALKNELIKKITDSSKILTDSINSKSAKEDKAVDSSKLEGETKAQIIAEARNGLSANGHNHNDLYYTKTEVNNKNNLALKGNIPAHAGKATDRLPKGFSVGQIYNNGYPIDYGNVLQVGGGGDVELALGWSGLSSPTAGAHAENYIRSKRDTGESIWSPWARLWTSGNFNPDTKSNTDHNHNMNYYTKSEVDNIMKNKSDVNHNHNTVYYSKTEVNNIVKNKADVNHTHNYLADGGTYSTIKLSNWIRTIGNSGWYSETYGGGWYMTDTDGIRNYNNKPLRISGADISCTNNVIAYYSDERLKKNFKYIDNALSKVMSIDAYYYEQNEFAKKCGYNEEGKIQIGFKAQEIEKLIPQVIHDAPINHSNNLPKEVREIINEEPIRTIDYGKLTPILWNALQELTNKVTSLEVELKILKSKELR